MTTLIVIVVVFLASAFLVALWSRRLVADGEEPPYSPALTELLALLDVFLGIAGETIWSKQDGRRHLELERDRYRCVHFTFGAIKRLAESTPNHELGNKFAGIASVKESSYWFGKDHAMDVIRRYGVLVNQSDLEVQIPAQAGYSLMDRFLVGNRSDLSDGYTSLKDELRTVIQGQSTVQPDLHKVLSFDGGQTRNLYQRFESFLDLLETPQLRGPSNPLLKTDDHRRRCLYFILGAGHRFALTLPSDEESGEFYRSMASQQGKALFGESQGEREVALHFKLMADPQQAPTYFFKNLEEGHSAMEQYLNGTEGFSPQTVSGVIRTRFADAVFGEDTSSGQQPEGQ